MRKLVLSLALSAFALPALAGMPFPKVFDRTVKKYCSSCHMIFNPEMLPSKSWDSIINGLDNHFGENIKLDSKVVAKIHYYHTNRASDISGSQNGRRFMNGIDRANPPLRITETPIFKKAHQKIAANVWTSKEVKLKSNCVACHAGAVSQGDYEGKNAKIPSGK